MIITFKKLIRRLFITRRQAIYTATYDDSSVIHTSAKIYSPSPTKIHIGARSHIHGTLMVWQDCGRIEIGVDCFVGDSSRIYSAGSIKIGNRVLIAHNCNLFDSNIHSLDPKLRHKEFIQNTTGPLICLNDIKNGTLTIEDDVWIGASAIILKNVTIGRCSIVGAGSVVVKNVPPYSVVAGNPAAVIKRLNPDQ